MEMRDVCRSRNVDSYGLRGCSRVAVSGGGDVMAVVGIDGRYVIDGSSDLSAVVSHLATVVRLAQGLPDQDQRRVRDFVRATLATLEATTALPKSDQRTFERALRG
jgi:hypothetical protein